MTGGRGYAGYICMYLQEHGFRGPQLLAKKSYHNDEYSTVYLGLCSTGSQDTVSIKSRPGFGMRRVAMIERRPMCCARVASYAVVEVHVLLRPRVLLPVAFEKEVLNLCSFSSLNAS